MQLVKDRRDPATLTFFAPPRVPCAPINTILPNVTSLCPQTRALAPKLPLPQSAIVAVAGASRAEPPCHSGADEGAQRVVDGDDDASTADAAAKMAERRAGAGHVTVP